MKIIIFCLATVFFISCKITKDETPEIPLKVKTTVTFKIVDIVSKVEFITDSSENYLIVDIKNIGESELYLIAEQVYFENESKKVIGQLGRHGEFLMKGDYSLYRKYGAVSIPIGTEQAFGIAVPAETHYVIFKDIDHKDILFRLKYK